MMINEEFREIFFPLMLDYQKNLTTLLEHRELLKPLIGKTKKKEEFKYEVVGGAKTSLCEEGLSEPQVDLLEEHASIHEGNVCIEDTSVSDGYTSDEKDEETTSCPTFDDHEEIFQSTDVEELLHVHNNLPIFLS
jgi:hypothetical protein